MLERWESIRKYLLYHAFIVWRTKDFWTRALLCWAIGGLLLINDEVNSYDWRLRLRGPRPAKKQVVLVDVSERDWSSLDPESRNVLRPLKEVVTFTDAYFWNPKAWEQLLSKLLAQEPASVGVSFFFGENIRTPELDQDTRAVFENPKIVWGSDVDSSGRVLVPVFASTYNSNVGLRGLRSDDDGIVRRFNTSLVQVPHLAVRVVELANPALAPYIEDTYQAPAIINYAGNTSSFETFSARDVLEGRIAPEAFKGKIVIIGSLGSSLEQMQTPLGRMSRTEALANVAENVIAKNTVKRYVNGVYLALMTLLMFGSIWVLITYPQSVTLVIFILAAIIWASASAWLFDVWRIWLPVFSPLVQLTVTCIVFLSYQLALNERRTWRLEQEQKYTSEIEQLKTNFVSMMSHDLKTPIAKIQAICDRLLATAPDGIATDLKTLRRSSDELHRYIQSILQVTKVEAKDFRIMKEVTDINEDIDKVLGRLTPLAQEKQIQIVTNLEPMFSIEVDTTLIQEVIHNLVENAIKYTPEGGRVTIVSQERDDNVMVSVEDTGPGIDPEDQKEIWMKFTRGRHQDVNVKGTGLGLYLVKYFIELHGGRVFLESTLGVGTKIGFTIPLLDESGAEPADAAVPVIDTEPLKRELA